MLYNKITNIEKILMLLKEWYMSREFEEKCDLSLYAGIMFEEVIYICIFTNDSITMKSNQRGKSTLIDHIWTHHLYKCWDF